MSSDLKIMLVISARLVGGIAAAVAQDTLPEGPGMQETLKACGNCHSVGTFRNIRRTSTGWETTMVNMTGWGMNLGGDQFDTVLEYLTTYLGTSPPPAAPPAR